MDFISFRIHLGMKIKGKRTWQSTTRASSNPWRGLRCLVNLKWSSPFSLHSPTRLTLICAESATEGGCDLVKKGRGREEARERGGRAGWGSQRASPNRALPCPEEVWPVIRISSLEALPGAPCPQGPTKLQPPLSFPLRNKHSESYKRQSKHLGDFFSLFTSVMMGLIPWQR